MRTIKIGKAAGYDGIETEHLRVRHAHPVLCLMLCMLFNSMLIHGREAALRRKSECKINLGPR